MRACTPSVRKRPHYGARCSCPDRAGAAAIDSIEHPPPLPIADLWARGDKAAVFMCGLPFSRAEPQPVAIAAPVPSPTEFGGEPRYWSDLVVRPIAPFGASGHIRPQDRLYFAGFSVRLRGRSHLLHECRRSVSALQRNYCTANHAARRSHRGAERSRSRGTDRLVCAAVVAAVPARVDLAGAQRRQNRSETHPAVGCIAWGTGGFAERLSRRASKSPPPGL